MMEGGMMDGMGSMMGWMMGLGLVLAALVTAAVVLVSKFATQAPRPAGTHDAAKPQKAFDLGAAGPQLSREAVRYLGISPPQVAEVNEVIRKYAAEVRALERRNTKIAKGENGHLVVTIAPHSSARFF